MYAAGEVLSAIEAESEASLQDSAVKTYDCDRKALIHKLMEIIAAPSDAEYLEEPKSLEELAFNAGELSSIAAKLLRQMLALYGILHHYCCRDSRRAESYCCLFDVRIIFEAASQDTVPQGACSRPSCHRVGI